MTALGLDKDSHNISIVYRAPQQLVKTQIFYNSIHLLYDDDVDMIWAVIKRTSQFIAFDLYVIVEAVKFNVGKGSQHTSRAEELHSVPVNVYPSFIQDILLSYNVWPCNEVDMDNIKEVEVLMAIHTREVRGLVTKMNIFKAMWMRHSILLPVEMCTKSSLIMMVQRTILNSLINYKWNTM
ncbi:hypothetical protein SO802_021604 [Lithocarpus litseifolius]|uniref:Uncharacterized protein n=1 Tax=Lithocarpus litseifolius TaxID=425828 RepID=A0AAW2CHG5_9ROSI